MKIPALNEIPDLTPVEPGEYDLFIRKAKETSSNDGSRHGIMLIIDIVGVDNAEALFDTMWLPNDNDDEYKTEVMWRMIKERIVALGLDPEDEQEISAFEGINFTGLLDIDVYQGKTKNILIKVTG